MNTILEVNNLRKRFGRKTALSDVSFSLDAGRVLGLMGPNGAGKTTLLKILMQLYRQDGGSIFVFGEKAAFDTKRHFAYMPDNNPLFRWMSVGDAIRYYRDMFPDFYAEKARDLCELMQIDQNERVHKLSRGTIERVLIMLTFARRAPIYLLDEPIAAIDPLGREKILKTILAGVDETSSVIVSTHLVKDVETILDDVLILNEGRLLLAEPAEKIREDHGKSIDEYYLEVLKNA